jgi:Flp pilus assembly CpaE family ATPase
VLNQTFPNASIEKDKLQKAIGRQFDFDLPYEGNEVLRALNLGSPYILSYPDLSISKNIEDMAYSLSGEFLKNIPPIAPSKAWKRVTGRIPVTNKKP